MATIVIAVKENTVSQLQNALCFAIQLDGSVNKCRVDNKFVTARFITEEPEIKSVFLGERKSSK